MERIIYCPNDEKMNSARNLAVEWNLPIHTGEIPRSISTIPLDVGILSIPENHYVDYSSPILIGEVWKLTYVDDFTDCELITGELYEIDQNRGIVRNIGMLNPTLRERHRLIFVHRFAKIGHYEVRILDGANEVCKNEIEVIENLRRQMI